MLRHVVLALCLAGIASTARAEDAPATLTVSFSNLEPGGALMLQLFDSEAAYSGGEASLARMVPVTQGAARLELADLAPGRYAFRLFHDVDGDGRMNTNPFGIPTEPFAFSNNARGRFGPASWDDAAFALAPGPNTQDIRLGGAF